MSTKAKGDFLENLTEILEKSISDKSTIISKNKKLEDLDGIVREIDIYIETIVRKRRFSIAIECKNYNPQTKIKIDMIGAFAEKCSRIPNISKMIFLTTSDYQSGAIKKAKTRNVELYKIISEPILGDGDDLGVKNISIIKKKCSILSLRFNSKKLFENGIKTEESLPIYSNDYNIITKEYLTENLYTLPEVWGFLHTKSGLLFNYKKRIYPSLKSKNTYTKYKSIYYPVESLKLTLEIEYSIEPLEINSIKKYHSITDESTLAIFSNLEFIIGDKKHQLCIVKTDEEKQKFFVSTSNEKPLELQTLGTLNNDAKPVAEINSKIRDVGINPLEHQLSQKTISETLSEDRIAPKEESLKHLKNLKSRRSSIQIAITDKKLFYMIPFVHNSKLITAQFPEPISMYFNHSIELYKKSIMYLETMAEHATSDDALKLQDDSYHKYIQYRVSSIFMLHSAIELFINSCIKDDFNTEIEGEKITKSDIEKIFPLSEKVEKIVPKISSFKLSSNKQIVRTINELNLLYEELSNLKTSDSIKHPFLETFESMIQFDMEKGIELVKEFFRKVNKNFSLNEM